MRGGDSERRRQRNRSGAVIGVEGLFTRGDPVRSRRIPMLESMDFPAPVIKQAIEPGRRATRRALVPQFSRRTTSGCTPTTRQPDHALGGMGGSCTWGADRPDESSKLKVRPISTKYSSHTGTPSGSSERWLRAGSGPVDPGPVRQGHHRPKTAGRIRL